MKSRSKKTIFFLALIMLVALGLAASPVQADTYWTGDDDYQWFNNSNWTDEVPDETKDAYINNGGTSAISDADASAQNLTLGDGPGESGNLEIYSNLTIGGGGGGGALTVGGTYNTQSSVNHNAGTVIADTLTLGRDNTPDPIGSPNQVNYYHMGGWGGTLQVKSILVGDGGTGYLAPQAGTTISVAGDFILGNQSTGSGMFDKQGGDLQVDGSLYVGYAGTGNYWHVGGSTTVNQNLILGETDTSYGYLSIENDTLAVLGDMVVGNWGNGTVDHSSGLLDVAGRLTMGANNSGEYNLSGDGFLQADSMGIYNNSTFNQTGGQLNVTWELDVFFGTVNHSGGNTTVSYMTLWDATYNLSDTAQLNLIDLWIQQGGTFNQTGGTLGFDNNVENFRVLGGTVQQSGGVANVNLLAVGQGPSTPGSYELSSGNLNAQQVVIGGYQEWGWLEYGVGTLTVENPNGYLPGEPGYPTITVGAFDNPGTMIVGDTATGPPANNGSYDYHGLVTQQDGQVTVNGNLLMGQNGDTHAYGPAIGVYELTGGSLTVARTSNPEWWNDGNLVVGESGKGYFNQSAGQLTVEGRTIVGNNYGSYGEINHSSGQAYLGPVLVGSQGTGVYNLSEDAELYHFWVAVGNASGSVGTFNQSGNSYHEGWQMSVGGGAGSTGTYNLSGGTIALENLYVGDYEGSDGTFNQTGGDVLLSGHLNLGRVGAWGVFGPATGVYNLEDGNLTVSGLGEPMRVGHGGTGTFNMSGGTLDTQNVVVGDAWDGFSGTGTFTQWGGTHTLHQIMVLGHEAGSQGTYTLQTGGTLDAQSITVGLRGTGEFNQEGGSLTVNDTLSVQEDTGTGTFSQSGGTSTINRLINAGQVNLSGDASMTILDHMEVGYKSSPTGIAYLSDTAQLTSNGNVMVGTSGGKGEFYQSGGTLQTAGVVGNDYLILGVGAGGDGYYELSGTGAVNVGALSIGFDGKGEFNMTGGAITLNYAEIGAYPGSTGKMVQSGGTVQQVDKPGWAAGVTLGREAGAVGTYNLSGATSSLDTFFLDVGSKGQGTFTQKAGTVHVPGPLYVGRFSGSRGTYNLEGGTLTNNGSTYIGGGGTGDFIQTGGNFSIDFSLRLGHIPNKSTGSGSYDLQDGTVAAKNMFVGGGGSGTFTQSGGTATVTQATSIGTDPDGSGTYTMSNGILTTQDLTVGSTGSGGVTGTLNITNALAQVSVGGNFTINERGQFNAVPGATIHMTGSNFSNQSTNPANVEMVGLTMLYSQNTVLDSFEVAGNDLGAVMAGFTNNFVLGTLELSPGNLQLVDFFNNAEGDTPEALYVSTLILGNNSILDLNNLHLYCLNLVVGQNVTFPDGTPQQVVPLPSTLLLLASALGGLALLGRRSLR